jgi:hypothetical protein
MNLCTGRAVKDYKTWEVRCSGQALVARPLRVTEPNPESADGAGETQRRKKCGVDA